MPIFVRFSDEESVRMAQPNILIGSAYHLTKLVRESQPSDDSKAVSFRRSTKSRDRVYLHEHPRDRPMRAPGRAELAVRPFALQPKEEIGVSSMNQRPN